MGEEPRKHRRFADRLREVLGIDSESTINLPDDEDVREPDTPSERIRKLASRVPAAARYRLRETLGTGGMGEVFKVWDEDLRRTLAMKVIRQRDDDSESGSPSPMSTKLLTRFLDEAQITAQLEHPGMVPIHDFGMDDQARVYFTMPFVRGMTLEEILRLERRGDPEWTRARILDVLLRSCEAIAYAHSRGVIHRDLKPSNIMVGKFGRTYVLDWGLAKVLGIGGPPTPSTPGERSGSIQTDRLDEIKQSPGSPLVTVDGQILGTPSHMPPEQALGMGQSIGTASDVYSLGSMLYTLLVGHSPYLRREEEKIPLDELLQRIVKGPPTPIHEIRSDVPAEVTAICEKAMARNTEDRYPTAKEMADDLRAYLEGRVVRAYRTGAWIEFRKWIARNRATAATLAALVVVAIGVSLAFAWMESNRKGQLADAYSKLEEEQAETQRLSDISTARILALESENRTPDEDGIAAMNRWLEDYQDLSSRFDLDAGDAPIDPAALALFQSNIYIIENEAPTIEESLEQAKSLEQRSIEDNRGAWDRAIEAIAASPRYAKLRIRPQIGLVPLHEDPNSKLWEFWHVLSGERPTWDPERSRWRVRPETGVVIVLLPGGTFQMGSPGDEPMRDYDEPRHEVTVGPFFLGKYEVTQAQWTRSLGKNPSYYPPGTEKGDVEVTPVNPVEYVSWNDAGRLARRLGLRLPTESEWEYGCRAGTETPFFWGAEAEALQGKENNGDASLDAVATEAGISLAVPASWNDGFPVHAPVGSLEANGFGLFDMHGNVSEWTASPYERFYGVDVEYDVSGEDLTRFRRERVARGGCFFFGPLLARSAWRQPDAPDNTELIRGCRLARDLVR